MKKLTLILMISTMLFGEHIFRHSESGIHQPEIEYLQGGILYRYDYTQVEKTGIEGKTIVWKYKEYWLEKDVTSEEAVEIIGEDLSQDVLEYLQGMNLFDTSTYWKIATVKMWLDDRGISYEDDWTGDELQNEVSNFLENLQ